MTVRRPNNKQLAVLAVLRDLGPLTCNQVADEMRARHPCGKCDGTGQVPDGEGYAGGSRCRGCYGWGHIPFHYSDAYQALAALLRTRHVDRRRLTDEFGDELRTHVYFATDYGVELDELETLYQAPAAPAALDQ